MNMNINNILKNIEKEDITIETIKKDHNQLLEYFNIKYQIELLNKAISNLEMEVEVPQSVKNKLFILLEDGYFKGVKSYCKMQASICNFANINNDDVRYGYEVQYILSRNIKVGISNFSEKKIQLTFLKEDKKID